MLSVTGLVKRYGEVTALDQVELTVERGQMVGFLGPNGAGKTTTMRAIMRLVDLDAGEITWDDHPVSDEVRRRFGYMPAERGMYQRMKVGEHLRYYGRLSGMEPDNAARESDRWLERLGLEDRSDSEVQDLSSGNQQRVQLALALLSDPELLVLDEPFSGLDPVAVDTLSEILTERVEAGAALLLSSHQLDLVAAVCSAVVIVDGGRVVLNGPVDEIRAGSEDRYLEVEFAAVSDWSPDVGTVTRTGHRVEVRTDRSVDPTRVLDDARAHGQVQSFRYAPPDLSQVFLTAVGRDQIEDDGDADNEGGRP